MRNSGQGCRSSFVSQQPISEVSAFKTLTCAIIFCFFSISETCVAPSISGIRGTSSFRIRTPKVSQSIKSYSNGCVTLSCRTDSQLFDTLLEEKLFAMPWSFLKVYESTESRYRNSKLVASGLRCPTQQDPQDDAITLWHSLHGSKPLYPRPLKPLLTSSNWDDDLGRNQELRGWPSHPSRWYDADAKLMDSEISRSLQTSLPTSPTWMTNGDAT